MSPIWIQVPELPPNQLNLENAKITWNCMRDFIEVDLAQDGIIGIPYFLRTRVFIDLKNNLWLVFIPNA